MVLVPTLEEKVVSRKGKLAYAKVDVDEMCLVSVENEVKTVPCILIFNKGQMLESILR